MPRLQVRSGTFLVLTLTFAAVARADGSLDKTFESQVRPILVRHCQECHGDDKPKGGFRIARLPIELANESHRETWDTLLRRVTEGEMPPESEPRLTEAEVTALKSWMTERLKAAESARAAQGRAVLRRLNRYEYENTVCDLLGIKLDLSEMLPPDSSAAGFDSVGEAHHTSSFLMERYLEAADAALNTAIANLPQPPLFKKRLSLQDERHVKFTTEKVFRPFEAEGEEGLVMFSSSPWQAITLSQFYPPDRGRYRFRISASAFQTRQPVTFRVDAGPMLMATRNHLVNYFDAPADAPRTFEFFDDLEARSTIRLLPYGLASAQAVNKIGADNYEGAGLAVEWVEIEGPLHDTWPPESHRRIFGDMPQGPAPVYNFSKRVEVVSTNPEVDSDRILRRFAERAFRRPVTDADVKPFLRLAAARRAQGSSFEQSIRVALKAILVSPGFLFLREAPGKLDDSALASRLSYFLWSTMPDSELIDHARKGTLREPDVLRAQVERMLDHPKAAAFTENFVGQWLGLRDIDFTEPSHILYPEYDPLLRESMVRETELFFAELLKNDLSLTNLVASDFTILNGRLAKHYGIPGIVGWEFQKVTLPPESHRGGVLTMASVLKVTANGTTTSPVVRGAWVLDRILGTSPPRPPADVPAVDPDIRGATTIREQLAKHRQLPSCATCHVKIDPPGFALESFDVIGGYREHYRSTGRGDPVTIDGRRMPYHRGLKVNPADQLVDGRKFANVDELKQLLLTDKDQLARSLTSKLLTYATGAAPSKLDTPQINNIVTRIRDRNYGLRSLVHEIVQSGVFQTK